MPTYVAMLRGINIGSRNRLSMPDLRNVIEGLGAGNVRTYVQSGNVIFTMPRKTPGDLAAMIEKGIKDAQDLDLRVVVRTAAEMAQVATSRPFPDADPAHLHVTFLDAIPDAAAVEALDGARFAPDVFRVEGRDVFLHCPNGYGRSRLSNDFFERKLGVAATTRNWRTVTALAELAGRALRAGG